jgi:hypothetical protein
MIRFALLLILSFGALTSVSAQDRVPEFRIDDIPYKPQSVRVEACSRIIGFDQRWRVETVNETDPRGREWRGLRSVYKRDEALAYFNHPIIKGTITPMAWVEVECTTGDWTADEAKARADRVAAFARKKGYKFIKTRRHRAAGETWHSVEYLTNPKGKPWTYLKTLFLVQNEKLHRVNLTRITNCSGFSGLLKSNQVHEVEVDGKIYPGRFGDTKVLVGNAVCSQRSQGQDTKFFNTITRTVK